MNNYIHLLLSWLLAMNPECLFCAAKRITNYPATITNHLPTLKPHINEFSKNNLIKYKPNVKTDSGFYNRLFLSADISGLFRTEIYKNFNPDARRTKAHLSLIPFYKYRNISIGFGSFITLERYQNKFLLAYWERSIISFGPAINYTLRNTKKVPILICTRFLHNIYNEHTRFNSIPLSMKFDYRSVVVGAGPTVRFNKTQISPTFSILTNFNDAPNNRKRIFTQSSLMINISRNIY